MEGNILVSILTPSFNRASLLKKLYDSLRNQSDFSFEWLIVDDGSNDNTRDVCNSFTKDKFDIKYIYKENGGKHTAINEGIKYCKGILTFIVDSDDWLTLNAIEEIKKYYFKYNNLNDIAGFSFLRQYHDGQLNITSNHENEYIASYNKVRIYEQRVGDMAEVYFTNILKQYPFPVFENEKFLGEDVIWIEIGKKYNLVFINEPIYVSKYLDNGLTKNRRYNNIKSCNGCYYRAKEILNIKLPFKLKIKTIIQLYVYGKFAKKDYKQIKKDCNHKFLLALLHFPSYILYKKWKKCGGGEIL